MGFRMNRVRLRVAGVLDNLDKIGGVRCDFRQLVEWGALGSFRHV